MTASRPALRVEGLEDRTVPTALGSPWPNPGTLTLSFAADGTPVGDDASQAAKAFGSIPAEVWQWEVLRAFQTWAVQTNADVALVVDGGQAFGTPGQAQGDFRFGDVRVGAIPLSNDSLANATAFDWSVGTWSGDLLFNTRARFAVAGTTPTSAADIFTVALHEAGHVFGLAHSDDPASAMSGRYTGPKTGPTPDDVATLRACYGARNADAYEGLIGNGSLLTATPVDTVTGAARLTADVTTNADADVYSLLNTSLLGTLQVKVKASGVSLLTPKVQLYDGWGRLLATATAAGPGQDVTLTVPKTLLNLGYFVKVTGATGDVFGIGGYELSVTRTDGLVLPHLLTETLLDNTLLGAVSLDNLLAGPAGGSDADARMDSKADVDHYAVTVPVTTDSSPRAMIASVTNTSGKAHPDLAVLDALGRPVPFQVLASDAATLTIQVTQLVRGGSYFVRVSNPAGADATGSYHLSVGFQAPVDVKYTRLAAGQLTPSAPAATTTLTVNAARLFEFALVSAAADSAATGGATLTVRDRAGKVVFTLSRDSGGMTNGSVYLAPGTYTISVAAAAGATDFWAGARVVSDPVGPYDSGTSTTYPEPPPPNDGTYTAEGSSQPAEPAPSDPSNGTNEAPPPPQEPTSYAEPDWYYQF